MSHLRQFTRVAVAAWYFGGFILLWIGLEALVLDGRSGTGLMFVAFAMTLWVALSGLLGTIARPPAMPTTRSKR